VKLVLHKPGDHPREQPSGLVGRRALQLEDLVEKEERDLVLVYEHVAEECADFLPAKSTRCAILDDTHRSARPPPRRPCLAADVEVAVVVGTDLRTRKLLDEALELRRCPPARSTAAGT